MKMTLDMISPGLCGGAQPKTRAEIRVPSIRGQLRWWFRLLGGFASQRNKGLGLRKQEDMIFGAARKDLCAASQLQLRVRMINDPGATPKDVSGFDREYGYFLYPLRSSESQDGKRAVFDANKTRFELQLNWRGDGELTADVEALAHLFGYLGSLGMRARRAMGALAFAQAQDQTIPPFADVINHFSEPDSICIREIAMQDRDDPIAVLAAWLRDWRAYLNASMNPNTGASGYSYAKNDHDVGLHPEQQPQTTYRPALGLPIIQRYRSTKKTVNWEPVTDNGMERFASPVILRPYRSPYNGRKKALVLFVEKYSWPSKAGVKLVCNKDEGKDHMVSSDLYNEMKKDSRLCPVAELSGTR